MMNIFKSLWFRFVGASTVESITKPMNRIVLKLDALAKFEEDNADQLDRAADNAKREAAAAAQRADKASTLADKYRELVGNLS